MKCPHFFKNLFYRETGQFSKVVNNNVFVVITVIAIVSGVTVPSCQRRMTFSGHARLVLQKEPCGVSERRASDDGARVAIQYFKNKCSLCRAAVCTH